MTDAVNERDALLTLTAAKIKETRTLASAAASRVSIGRIKPSELTLALELAIKAQNTAGEALNLLARYGVVLPVSEGVQQRQEGERFDLGALATLSTPNASELLDLLARAVVVAERVDAERGNALPEDVPLQPGESRGTDFAESLSGLVFRLRKEVNAPEGRDG